MRDRPEGPTATTASPALNAVSPRSWSVRSVAGVGIAALVTCCAPERNSPGGTRSAVCEFESTQRLDVVSSPAFDGSPTVSPDERELFFTSDRKGKQDLFVSTRQSKDAPWNEPVNLAGPIDDPSASDVSLRLSYDALSLYFASTRPGGFGKADMYVATRKSRRDWWGAAVNLGAPLNTDAFEAFATLSADGTELYFNRSTTFDSQDSDIWVTTRVSREQEWGAPRRLPREINSERAEFSPSLSADGKTLYFASERGGSIDIWVSTRTSTSQEWSSPRRLGPEVNAAGAMTLAPFISSDLQTLYFMSARPDSVATKPCTPQSCFNRVDLYVAGARCR
jgi:WD40-like Beta Propeller Repeat